MTHRKPQRLFVAGTDTEVGKTYVAALIAARMRSAGRRVGVYKPVASGCEEHDGILVSEDAVALWEAAGRPRCLEDVCPQRFAAPLAPPRAAAAEGKSVDVDLLLRGAQGWIEDSDLLLIEGAGGLLSPLAEGVLNLQLAQELEAEIILVTANRLGAIHQVLATSLAAEHRGVKPKGIFFSCPRPANDGSQASNPGEVQRYCDVPILGIVPYQGDQGDVSGIDSILR